MNNPQANRPSAMRTPLFSFLFVFAALLTLSACDDDDNGGVTVEPVDLTGTYAQQDIMGRPGITTVFGGDGKDAFNASLPTTRADFQDDFEGLLETYHDVYGNALGVDLDYEENILGLDAATFTTVLAQFDALQVAPDGPTVYADPANGVFLTGRRPQDDIVDVSLILSFGGTTGARFNGDNGTPVLTTDNVGPGDRNFPNTFPYLEEPLN